MLNLMLYNIDFIISFYYQYKLVECRVLKNKKIVNTILVFTTVLT